MREISVHDLEPGMIVARDILAASSHLLLSAETRLTSKHIRMLRARDIATVVIHSNEDEPVTVNPHPAHSHISEEQQQHLLERFSYNDLEHPFTKELIRICKTRLGVE